MAVETKDRAKLGQTTYKASGAKWLEDGSDWRDVDGGEYKTLPAAKLAAWSWLRKGATQFTIWRGTYVDYVYENDPDYGDIYDAEWQQDEHWIVNGWGDDERGIEWFEESW